MTERHVEGLESRLGKLESIVERLERDDPGYTLGRLLSDLSERALPPSLWDELAGGLRAEVQAVTGVRRLH